MKNYFRRQIATIILALKLVSSIEEQQTLVILRINSSKGNNNMDSRSHNSNSSNKELGLG